MPDKSALEHTAEQQQMLISLLEGVKETVKGKDRDYAINFMAGVEYQLKLLAFFTEMKDKEREAFMDGAHYVQTFISKKEGEDETIPDQQTST